MLAALSPRFSSHQHKGTGCSCSSLASSLRPSNTINDFLRFPGTTGLMQTMSLGFKGTDSSLLNYAAVSIKFLPQASLSLHFVALKPPGR